MRCAARQRPTLSTAQIGRIRMLEEAEQQSRAAVPRTELPAEVPAMIRDQKRAEMRAKAVAASQELATRSEVARDFFGRPVAAKSAAPAPTKVKDEAESAPAPPRTRPPVTYKFKEVRRPSASRRERHRAYRITGLHERCETQGVHARSFVTNTKGHKCIHSHRIQNLATRRQPYVQIIMTKWWTLEGWLQVGVRLHGHRHRHRHGHWHRHGWRCKRHGRGEVVGGGGDVGLFEGRVGHGEAVHG